MSNSRNSLQHQQKVDMSCTMDCKQRNDIMKKHNKRGHIALNCEMFGKKNSIKCLYYAKGHCRRGNHCWYEHSNDESSIKRNKNLEKELYHNNDQFQMDNHFQNDNQLQNENCQIANEKKNDNFNDCNLTFGEGENMLNRNNEHFISVETEVDDSILHSKSLEDCSCEGFEAFQDHKIVEKTHDGDSIKYNIEVDQNAKGDEEESWQEDIEEKASSCNGCTFAYGEDSKTLQENNEDLSFEENDHCKGISKDDNYNEIENNLKYHEFAIKPFESKKKEYDMKEGKSQLIDTATSSENLSALSSTASLDHIQDKSSLVSPSTQFQVPQISNLTTSIVDDRFEVSSINSLEVCGNTSNAKSLKSFISNQSTPLHVPSNHPHMFYSNSLLNKTTNIASSRSNNTSPPTQYQQLCDSFPQKHGIWQNDITQSSPFPNAISSIPPTNQSLLSSLTNSQQPSQNMNFVSSSMIPNDYNVSLKHRPQPPTFDDRYHQTSMLTNSFQQQQYYFNDSLSPHFIHSSRLQNDYQPVLNEPSLIDIMQHNNKSVLPPPPPSMKWPSPSTTMVCPMKPIQVEIPIYSHQYTLEIILSDIS